MPTTIKLNASIERQLEQALKPIYDNFNRQGDGCLYIEKLYTFSNIIIFGDRYANRYFEVPYTFEKDGVVVFGEPSELEEALVAKKALQAGKSLPRQLCGPIVMKSEDDMKRIVYAAVLVPGEEDSNGEPPLSEEEITDACHLFMEKYGLIDYQHTLNKVGVPVECFILPFDWVVPIDGKEEILKKGTWILGVKVLDDSAWEEVKNKTLTGLSIMGVRNEVKKASKSRNTAVKALLADLGEDWQPVAVSLVDEPAVPKAKFFAIKSAQNKKNTWLSKIKSSFSSSSAAAKAGRKISDDTYSKLQELSTTIQQLLQEAEKERNAKKYTVKEETELTEQETKDLIKEEIATALEEFGERIAEIIKPVDTEEPTEPEAEEPSAATETGDKALKQKLSELEKLIIAASKSKAIKETEQAPGLYTSSGIQRNAFGVRKRKN